MPMTKFRLSVALGLALFASACANIPSDFKFKPDGTTGLVVGSVSFESGLGRYFLVAQNLDSLKVIELGFGCSMVPCIETSDDSAYSANESPKQRGGGYAVEVPEGRYRIIGWHVVQGYINSRSKVPPNVPFAVERGKASYLGNLHFDAHWESVQLRDRASRDLPLLKTSYAFLNSTPFAYTIAPGASLPNFGGDYRRGPEGPIFVPMIPIRR
jgi:hypothetical protein